MRHALISVALALACAIPANAEEMKKADEAAVKQTIAGWPKVAKQAAEDTIKKYGQPNEATSSQLIWNRNGPWKRTIVYREEVDHSFPMPHKDVLEQFVDYKAPVDKYDELAAYDGSVIVERTKGEISARCDKEGANFLALNLADEVATGKKSVEEARQFYGETIQGMMAGKSSPYLEKLQFKAPTRTADADQPLRMAQKESTPR